MFIIAGLGQGTERMRELTRNVGAEKSAVDLITVKKNSTVDLRRDLTQENAHFQCQFPIV